MQAWEAKVVKENSTEKSFQIKIPVAAAIGRLIDHTILYMFSYEHLIFAGLVYNCGLVKILAV